MDEELVNKVVKQVLEALKAQGVAGGLPVGAPSMPMPPNVAAATPAPARPTAKAISADLTARLRSQQHTAGGNRVLAAPGKPAVNASHHREPGKVFITADALARRVSGGAAEGGVVELAHNEFLTPSAEEVAERKHWIIKRQVKPIMHAPPAGQEADPVAPGSAAKLEQAVVPSAAKSSRARAGSIGIIVHKSNSKVESVLAAMAADGVPLVDYGQGGCWMTNLQGLCEAIVAGKLAMGVAILPYAADAMVLANKIHGVLAVQGCKAESVAAGVRHFGANLLVLEHAMLTYHEMRQMVRVFAAPRQAPIATALLEHITNLEACKCV